MRHDCGRPVDLAEHQAFAGLENTAAVVGPQVATVGGNPLDLLPLHVGVGGQILRGWVLQLDRNMLAKRHGQAEIMRVLDLGEVDGVEQGALALNIAEEVHQGHLDGRYGLVVIEDPQDDGMGARTVAGRAAEVADMQHADHARAINIEDLDLGSGVQLGHVRPQRRHDVALPRPDTGDFLPGYRFFRPKERSPAEQDGQKTRNKRHFPGSHRRSLYMVIGWWDWVSCASIPSHGPLFTAGPVYGRSGAASSCQRARCGRFVWWIG